MTPGNNGASTPEDDDPFGYLYADGQANGAQPPSGGYGYPNSVSRVRPVGERQYGQPQQQTAQYGQYGQQQPVPQQGAYGQPNAHYAAPETFPGGGAPTSRQQAVGGGRGRGPNTKGLLIGAVAVVAAVVIGIVVVIANGDDGNDDNKASDQVSTSSSASPSASPSESSTGEANEVELPKIDAKALKLGGSASLASDVKGAQADGGIYVQGFNQVGASVTWTVDGIKKAGTYRLYVRYSLPAEDADGTMTVNGKAASRPLNMKNFGGLPANEWQTTWAQVSLTKGTNTIQLSCQQSNHCNALLDQFSLTENVDQ